MPKLNSGTPVKCDCGKLVAIRRDGEIFIMCKHCKKQIPLSRMLEPRAFEPRAV